MTDFEADERYQWHRLTLRERLRVSPIVHELWCLQNWTGLRERLRCPNCRSVGTWKPHGGLLYRWLYQDIHGRRWLCKWCGHFNSRKGRVVAYLDMEKKYWTVPVPGEPRQLTPAEALAERLPKAWPWMG